MHAENVDVQVHYVPLHYRPFFQERYSYERGASPNARESYEGLVSLPLFPRMTDDNVTDVITVVEKVASAHAD
jgi:dTDP-4-amino-4,6-dideoxygalactose transaminase